MFQKISLHSSRFTMIALIMVIVVSLFGAALQPASAAEPVALTIPSVVKGQSATIKVTGMPANKDFRVLMNKMGTQGVGGTVVGTARTDQNGSFTKTFAIPSQLKNEPTIAVRVEATDATGWYAYNWFTNSTSGSSSSGSSSGSSSSSSGSSSSYTGSTSGAGAITIVDVDEDTGVDISAQHLSANRTYPVWFDWRNQSGSVMTTQSGTVKSDANGKVVAFVKMPSILRDRRDIRVRFQPAGGSTVAASAWFYNAESDSNVGGAVPAGSDAALPYISVGPVVENTTVTLDVYKFPKKMKLDAYMGKMGTKGENGTYIETITTPKDSTHFTVTLDIPKNLKDKEKIAVRLEAADGSAYYAYSWFYNTTDSTGQ